MSAVDAAFVAPSEAHCIEELVDVELESLGHIEIPTVEPHVVSKRVKRWNQSVIGVGQSLRGERANQMIIPEDVRVCHVATKIKLRGTPGQRRIGNSLILRPCRARS